MAAPLVISKSTPVEDKQTILTDANDSPFRLLDLPVELQLMIFESTVTSPSPTNIVWFQCFCHECYCTDDEFDEFYCDCDSGNALATSTS